MSKSKRGSAPLSTLCCNIFYIKMRLQKVLYNLFQIEVLSFKIRIF